MQQEWFTAPHKATNLRTQTMKSTDCLPCDTERTQTMCDTEHYCNCTNWVEPRKPIEGWAVLYPDGFTSSIRNEIECVAIANNSPKSIVIKVREVPE
jgi:hypothetical protein